MKKLVKTLEKLPGFSFKIEIALYNLSSSVSAFLFLLPPRTCCFFPFTKCSVFLTSILEISVKSLLTKAMLTVESFAFYAIRLESSKLYSKSIRRNSVHRRKTFCNKKKAEVMPRNEAIVKSKVQNILKVRGVVGQECVGMAFHHLFHILH